jgi:DNA-nicking Smr family endonuclease
MPGRPPEEDPAEGADPQPDGGTCEIPIEAALDLHAFAPRDIPSLVEEYVRAAHEAGLREVRLIHGRGKGVQRGIVQAALERHPLVERFYDPPESHLGATVAVLREV